MSVARRRIAWVGGVLGVVLLAPAGSAVAVSYATLSSPQYVSGYDSWARTYGDWTASRASSTKVRSYVTAARYRYFDADNHTTYINLRTASPGSADLNTHSSHDNVSSGAWASFRTVPSTDLYPSALAGAAVRVDATVQTCLDIPLRPDVCSAASKTLGRSV